MAKRKAKPAKAKVRRQSAKEFNAANRRIGVRAAVGRRLAGDLDHGVRLPVAAIRIGPRFRKDYGDIEGLAASIDELGLLQPVVITPEHKLIAGQRRILAWKKSRFAAEPIPVNIVNLERLVHGERAENVERKNFSFSELVAIKKECEPLEKAKAIVRQRAGHKVAAAEKGRTSDKIAAVGGKSGRSLDKAEAVVDAAERDPERFGKLVEQMDKTGRVDGVFKRLKNTLQGDALRKEPPAMPGKGPYRVFVFDMPWASEPDGDPPEDTGRGYYDYSTMNTEQMVAWAKSNNVPALYHPDGVWVWFWVTNFHLVHNHHLPVLEALGLEAVHMRTWAKDKMGRGQVLRGQTEQVLLCKRGKPPAVVLTKQSTLLPGKVRKDSQKPDQFYADVEALTPASRYVEFFARRKMPVNWDGYGDQVGTLEGAPAAAPSPYAFKAKVRANTDGRETGPTLHPPMVDVLVAKAAAGEIAFAEDGSGWCARLGWFDGDRFEHLPLHNDAHRRKTFRGELSLERQGSTIIVHAFTDETGLTWVGSTVPVGKLRKFLAAWKRASTIPPAAAASQKAA